MLSWKGACLFVLIAASPKMPLPIVSAEHRHLGPSQTNVTLSKYIHKTITTKIIYDCHLHEINRVSPIILGNLKELNESTD